MAYVTKKDLEFLVSREMTEKPGVDRGGYSLANVHESAAQKTALCSDVAVWGDLASKVYNDAVEALDRQLMKDLRARSILDIAPLRFPGHGFGSVSGRLLAIETTTTKIPIETRTHNEPNYTMAPQSAPVVAVQAPAVPTHPDPSMFATASGALLDALCWVVDVNRRGPEEDSTYRLRGMFAASRKIIDHVIAGDSGRHHKARAGALRSDVECAVGYGMKDARSLMAGLRAYEAGVERGMRPARARQEAHGELPVDGVRSQLKRSMDVVLDAYDRYRAQGL